MNGRSATAVAIIAILFLAIASPGSRATTAAPSSARASTAPPEKPLVVFLVRHGEKIDRSDDAALSAAGRERAATLAGVLRSAEIEHVHSSNFSRTRETAAPIAAARKLEIESYDHEDLPALVLTLRRTRGRHLVVGHSTTTPKMVALLGGTPGPAIDESGEFDRLYLVTIGGSSGASGGGDGIVSSVMLRYGTLYEPKGGK